MLAFVARRLVLSIPVVITATAIVFGLVTLRGDPLAELRNSSTVDEATIDALTQRYHLDDPVPVRYGRWLGQFVRGNWGVSFATGRPVAETIGRALPNTLMLLVGAASLSLIVAFVVGVAGAVRPHGAVDHVLAGLSWFGLSTPVFWFGIMLQLLLVTVPIDLWGVRVFYSSGKHSTGNTGFGDLLRHLTLPVVTLSLAHIAAWSRFQRSSLLEVLSADYVRTARAKGVPERRVVLHHAARNALLPFVTVSALGIAAMVGGAVVTERVFAWPGMGTEFMAAVRNDDYPFLLAWLALVAVVVVVANVATDVAYRVLAPQTVDHE